MTVSSKRATRQCRSIGTLRTKTPVAEESGYVSSVYCLLLCAGVLRETCYIVCSKTLFEDIRCEYIEIQVIIINKQ